MGLFLPKVSVVGGACLLTTELTLLTVSNHRYSSAPNTVLVSREEGSPVFLLLGW